MKLLDSVFAEVVTVLEKRWHVQPTLYASYAVSKVVGAPIAARDIDILLPGKVMEARQEFITAFEEAGFTPVAGPILTLRKDGIDVEFSPYEYWQAKCNFDASSDIAVTHPYPHRRLGVANLIALYTYLIQDSEREESKRRYDFTKLEALHLAYEQGIR